MGAHNHPKVQVAVKEMFNIKKYAFLVWNFFFGINLNCKKQCGVILAEK